MFKVRAPFQAFVRGRGPDCWNAFVQTATHVSFRLARQRVTSNPSAKKISEVALELRSLGPSRVEQLFAASSWLGASERASLIAMLRMDRMLLRTLATRDLYEPIHNWEDVALFSGSDILAWTTSHELEAMFYGTKEKLLDLGLEPSPAKQVSIRAEALDADAFAQIIQLAM